MFVRALCALAAPGARAKRDHCSDYSVVSQDGSTILNGHNEDGGIESVNNTFFVNITMEDTGLSFAVRAGLCVG